MFAGANVERELHFFIFRSVPYQPKNMISRNFGDSDAVPGEALALPHGLLRTVSEDVGEVGDDDQLVLRHHADIGYGHRLQSRPIFGATRPHHVTVTRRDHTDGYSVRPAKN